MKKITYMFKINVCEYLERSSAIFKKTNVQSKLYTIGHRMDGQTEKIVIK